MKPRVHEIRSGSRVQQTPAPLLATRRGQLPNVPIPLAQRVTPAHETLLLSLPILDWHILNANSGRRGAKDLPLSSPCSSSSMTTATIADFIGYTNHIDAMFFLTARASTSRQTLCDAPGKSLTVRVDPTATKGNNNVGGITAKDAVNLHKRLGTDFAIVLTDSPSHTYGSRAARKRRAFRAVEQCKSYCEHAVKSDVDMSTIIISVQGGCDEQDSEKEKEKEKEKAQYQIKSKGEGNISLNNMKENDNTSTHVNKPINNGDSNIINSAFQLESFGRKEFTKAVVTLPAKGGLALDGMYAGESPSARLKAVRDVLKQADTFPGVRVLTGGNGAPWEVLRAIGVGVDIIDASYPFDMADMGYATRLSTYVFSQNDEEEQVEDYENGREYINVRERKWETCQAPVVPNCVCYVCKEFSRGYIRHLFEVHEMMGVTLVAVHNLFDYLTWFKLIRQAIAKGDFEKFVHNYERRRNNLVD